MSGVRQQLRQARGLRQGLGPAVGRHVEGAHPVGLSGLLQFLLGPPHPGDLRRGVDHRRDGAVIHLGGTPGDHLGHHHAFLGPLVRQHRPAHQVADRPDAIRAGAAVPVHLHVSSLGQDDPGALVDQAFGRRPSADRHHQLVHGDVMVALAVAEPHFHVVVHAAGAFHLRAQARVQPLALELALRLAGNLAVGHEQEAVHGLKDRDLRPQPVPDAAEFQPDDAAADDAQALRRTIKLQRAFRVHYVFAVKRGERQFHWQRTGGQNDVFGGQQVRIAVVRSDLHLPAGKQLPPPVEGRYAVGPEQRVDARRELAHDAVLAVLHRVQGPASLPGS